MKTLSNMFNFYRIQEIDHKISRTLVIPFLKDVGVVQLGRSGAFIEVGCDVVWCHVMSCGVIWSRVVWCGMVWCGVEWCKVVWCDLYWPYIISLSSYSFILKLTLLALFSFTGQTRHLPDRRWVTPRTPHTGHPHRHRHFPFSIYHYLCHCLSPCGNFNLFFWCVSTSKRCRQLLSEQQVEASRSNAGADLEPRFHIMSLLCCGLFLLKIKMF